MWTEGRVKPPPESPHKDSVFQWERGTCNTLSNKDKFLKRVSCLPIISQITQVIQRQGASLLSRHLDIHSDLRLRITLKRSTPAHREGNRVDKHLSEVERQMPEEGRKPRADTRAAPASGSDSSMSEERCLQAGRTAQELGTGRTLGMPRAGAALRDVRNAEDRTCPAFSRGKNNHMVLLLLSSTQT